MKLSLSLFLSATIAASNADQVRSRISSSTESSTKDDIEVVVSHYDEDLTWISDDKKIRRRNPIRYTIYSKNQDNAQQLEGTISLPNVGRESQTFLHHIVTNYQSLADWTIFTQGSKPSFGFMANNDQSGHLCSGVTWDDYLKPKQNDDNDNDDDDSGWYEVQTVATHYPQMYHSDRFDMMFQIPQSKGNICPTDFTTTNGGIGGGWSNWWIEQDHPLLSKQKEDTDDGIIEFIPPVEFYNKYIVAGASDKYYEEFTLNYANGGRFAVSRERIYKRSLSYYENLLEILSKNINPIEGYYMETMWYDVFHPEKLQAEYGPVCNSKKGGSLPTLSSLNNEVSNHETMFKDINIKYQNYLLNIYGTKSAIPRNLQQSSPYLISTTTTPPPEPDNEEEEEEHNAEEHTEEPTEKDDEEEEETNIITDFFDYWLCTIFGIRCND